MKIRFIIILLAAISFAQTGFGQEGKTAVTDDELKKYAEVMDSVNEMTAEARIKLTEMVKENDSISATRYNELIKVINDSTQLATVKATPEEIAFVKQIIAKREEETAHINKVYQSLAKDYVTLPVFNKVKKALAQDASLKSRYDAMMAELAKDDPTGAGE